jgi:fibronectin type 3 domain-containing protein
MFGKINLLVVIALAMLCMACDLEGDKKKGGETTPPTPINVTATPQSSTDINVRWNTVSGATSYEVHYQTGSLPVTRLTTVVQNQYTHIGLQPNTTYYYYVSARNEAGESALSSRATATTHPRSAF